MAFVGYACVSTVDHDPALRGQPGQAGKPPDPSIRWLVPALVAEISFTTWSGDGRLRHPVFLGLREDKPASDVVMPVADVDAVR